MMAILDADKKGFLRSETALIQTMGRAARNAEGRVIMYAELCKHSFFSYMWSLRLFFYTNRGFFFTQTDSVS